MREIAAVRELQVGEVVLMAYDPDDKQLHWLRSPHLAESHLLLVDCTVVENVPEDETEVQAGAGGLRYKQITHLLRLIYNGKRWTVHPAGGNFVHRLPEHHERCGSCGEIWPCRERRLDAAADRLIRDLDSRCAHCGLPIGGAWSDSFNDGLTTRRYHTAKKHRANGKSCAAALAEARSKLPEETA